MPNAKQKKINSPFAMKSTAKEVIAGHDLSGKTAIVTGGYSGIGLETTRALVDAGATVIVPARSLSKAEKALAPMAEPVIIAEMDLANDNSVRSFADKFVASGRALDLLINNAGIMATPELQKSPEGYEIQFATNHLGHFILTAHLLPALRKAGKARVVALSSIGHARSPVVFDDIHFAKRDYDKWSAYGQAKTANALFAVELDRLFSPEGINAYAVHPGGIMTDLQRNLPKEEMMAMGWIDENGKTPDLFKNTEQGASTTIWAATSPDLAALGGVYCEDCNVADIVEERGFTGIRDHAINPEFAKELWAVSEKLTGSTFRP